MTRLIKHKKYQKYKHLFLLCFLEKPDIHVSSAV